MATRKKSESGAYMSQYDTEVEKRLKALESQTHPDRGTTGSDVGLSRRVEIIERILRMNPELNFDKLSADM